MPIALDKMPVIDGGRVDVSAPNDSGLNTLGRALDVSIRSVAEIGQQAQLNEFMHVKSLMEDATIGPDEAKEIAGNAFFPLNRFAAQNRAGEAKVAAARNKIEDELALATDPIHAREILRRHQQDLMDSETEPGVQAGIRQAIADMAGPALNKASATRVELRNLQRQKDESFILQNSISDDPMNFVTSLQGILGDQMLDATREPDIHATAAQTLLNTLVERPSSLIKVRNTATAVLKSKSVTDAADRARYTAVIKAANTLEDQINAGSTETERKKQVAGIYGGKVLDHINVHGTMPPDEILQPYLQNSTDRLTAMSKVRSALEGARGASVGLVGSEAYINGRKLIDSLFTTGLSTRTDYTRNATKAAAHELYDQIMSNVDPEGMDPREAGVQANTAAQLAYDRAKEFSEQVRAKKPAEIAKQEEEIKTLNVQLAAAVKGNDPAAKERIWKQLSSLKKATGVELRRQLYEEALTEAEKLGIDINRDLRP